MAAKAGRGPARQPGRAVTVHGIAHARAAAAAAAECGVAVTLLSGPEAGVAAGPAWFGAILERIARERPEAAVEGALDCGGHAGCALAAFREGIGTVVYRGPAETRLRAIAEGFGFSLLADRPESLDLSAAGPEAEAACRAWLAAGAGTEIQNP